MIDLVCFKSHEEEETIRRDIQGPRLYVTSGQKKLRLTIGNRRLFVNDDYLSVPIGSKKPQ